MAKWYSNPSSWVDKATLAFVVICAAWHFSPPLRHASFPLPYFEDDFFYYARIAVNIAAGKGSTFDGTTPTNGYHPLYEVLLVIAARCGPGLRTMLIELYLLGIAATIATFVFARRLFKASGAELVLANALALLSLWLPLRMFYQCMEVTLTIPLAVALVWYFVADFSRDRVSMKQAAGLGALAVVMVLSRLDSAFLLALLVVIGACYRDVRSKLPPTAAMAFVLTCSLPLLAYFEFNHALFHVWLPISGLAKQLRSSHWPSHAVLQSAWAGNTRALTCIAMAGLALWVLTRRRFGLVFRAITLAMLLFPFVQIGVLAILSDWRMWGWYHYVYCPAIVALLLLPVPFLRDRWIVHVCGSALLLAACFILISDRWKVSSEMAQIADSARLIQAFAATHPGTYAIGDRAGMVGWLVNQPIFQAEGLVEDDAWLATVRSRQDLATALRARGVRYYIYTEWLVDPPDPQPAPGCYTADEPSQAGPGAPRLTAVFCSPIIDFPETHEPDILDKRLLIFDLQRTNVPRQ